MRRVAEVDVAVADHSVDGADVYNEFGGVAVQPVDSPGWGGYTDDRDLSTANGYAVD